MYICKNLRTMEKGFNEKRLNNEFNKMERQSLKVFNEDYIKNIDLIVHGANDYGEANGHLSERERKVALSVIHWIGTPVGQAFIKKVFNIDDKYLFQQMKTIEE